MTETFNKALGRWQVLLPGGRREYRYRWLMEQHLGRKLTTDEHVHHINGDPTDDRLENLVVLSASEHQRLHGPARAERARARRGDSWGPNGLAACVECGEAEKRHFGRGLCSTCYSRERNRRLYGHAPRKLATVLELVCENCGVEFTRTLKQGTGRYCSRPCSSQASAKRRWDERRAGVQGRIGKVAA